jgi:hypothetical protein
VADFTGSDCRACLSLTRAHTTRAEFRAMKRASLPLRRREGETPRDQPADLAVGIDHHVPGQVSNFPGPQPCLGRQQHNDRVAQGMAGAAGEHEKVAYISS